MTYDAKTRQFATTDLALSMASVAAAYPLRVQPQTDTKYADVKESISMPSIRTVL